MKAKATCWMAKRPDGTLNHYITAFTRRDCTARLQDWFVDNKQPWRRLYRQGWRIVRVKISEA